MSSVIVFDVNETLSDLSPLAARFVAVGAPASAASLWFTSVLRDGFALSVAGVRPDFAEVVRESLAARLSVTTLDQPLDQAVEHVLGGLTELPVHADVTQGVQDLAAAGFRLVTLSNGGTALGESCSATRVCVTISSGCCPSTTHRHGSPPARPMGTPPGSAASRRRTWCWSPAIPGTSTARSGPGSTPCGSIGTRPTTPGRSARRRTPSPGSTGSPRCLPEACAQDLTTRVTLPALLNCTVTVPPVEQ